MERDIFGDNKKEMLKPWGVLLWSVVRADGNIAREEVEKMRQYLKEAGLDAKSTEEILSLTRRLEEERIDLYSFVRHLAKVLDYAGKKTLVKELFSVAFSDKSLSAEELEVIRKISHIFYLSHKDFIQAKIEAQREAGIKTLDF